MGMVDIFKEHLIASIMRAIDALYTVTDNKDDRRRLLIVQDTIRSMGVKDGK